MILIEVFKLVVYVYRPFHWFWHLKDDITTITYEMLEVCNATR
jgi:hypothetical protein